MAERHFVLEAFRIGIGKEGEKGSGEVCGENSTPTDERLPLILVILFGKTLPGLWKSGYFAGVGG